MFLAVLETCFMFLKLWEKFQTKNILFIMYNNKQQHQPITLHVCPFIKYIFLCIIIILWIYGTYKSGAWWHATDLPVTVAVPGRALIANIWGALSLYPSRWDINWQVPRACAFTNTYPSKPEKRNNALLFGYIKICCEYIGTVAVLPLTNSSQEALQLLCNVLLAYSCR